MKPIAQGLTFLTIVAALSGDPKQAQAGGADKPGWVARLCPAGTKAASVKLRVGLTGDVNQPGRREWGVIARNADKPVELAVPKDLRDASGVWLMAESIPAGQAVDLCLLKSGRPVSELIFVGSIEREVTINQSQDCAC